MPLHVKHSETISLGSVGGTLRSGRRSDRCPGFATTLVPSQRLAFADSRRLGAQLKKSQQTERSFFRHSGFAQTGEISGLEQLADFRHTEIFDGHKTGNA